MFSVFLSGYRNTCESLGELEKAEATHACGSRSHSISFILNSPPTTNSSCLLFNGPSILCTKFLPLYSMVD